MAGKYRRPATPEQRARADQARADKLSGLHDTLTEQVTDLAAGPQWRAWLDVASRFHRYSVNNTLLILAQRPQATQVAGYTLWQQLGRQVDNGEKGIAILAPVTRKPAADATTDESGNGTAGPEADPTVRAAAAGSTSDPSDQTAVDGRRRVVGWRPTYVWDVSQTSGDPLPEPTQPELLAGQAPESLWDALAAQCEAAGMTVRRHTVARGGPNGWTDYAAHEVVVRDDVDDAQAVKTLAHELGHVLLHDPGQFDGEVTRGCRGTREVEAESVAYLVAAAEGLDTSSYTFAYVAGWAASAGDDVEATVRATAGRVLGTAHQVLDTIENDRAPADDTAAAAGADVRAVDQVNDQVVDPEIGARISAGAARTGQLRAAAVTASLNAPGAQDAPGRTDPERLLAVHTAAWEHYRSAVIDSWVPAYLDERFGDIAGELPTYGYARAGWTDLVDQLVARGFDIEELVDAGVAVRARTGRVVDRFRDRLMVPIEDVDQRVIAFIGRRNPAHDVASTTPTAGRAAPSNRQLEPKYLNTATTALYRKGDHLAGVGTCRLALARGTRPVLVEGLFDAAAVDVACRRTGSRQAVGLACLGTAVTDRQAAQLAATLPPGAAVVIATDADTAGDAAAARSYNVLTRHGLEPRRALLPPGTDPADLASRGGSAVLAAAIEKAEPLARQLAVAAVERFDLRWVEQQVAASRAAANVIAKAPATTWLNELSAVAERTGLDRGQLTLVAAEYFAHQASRRDGDYPAAGPAATATPPEPVRKRRLGAADGPNIAARVAGLSVPAHATRVTAARPRPSNDAAGPAPLTVERAHTSRGQRG